MRFFEHACSVLKIGHGPELLLLFPHPRRFHVESPMSTNLYPGNPRPEWAEPREIVCMLQG